LIASLTTSYISSGFGQKKYKEINEWVERVVIKKVYVGDLGRNNFFFFGQFLVVFMSSTKNDFWEKWTPY